MDKKNKDTHTQTTKKTKDVDVKSIESILNYCKKNYDLEKIVLVFHPGTPHIIETMASETGFNTFILNTTGDEKSWAVSSSDGHWSCYGHHEVAKQIRSYLSNYLRKNESKMKIALKD